MVVQVTEGFIWIPRPFSTNYIVQIVSGSTTDTVTVDVLDLECSRIVTNGIGEFSLMLDNNENTYNNRYSGSEIVNIYIDYENATNLLFKGKIETAKRLFSPQFGNQLEIKGGHISSGLLDITVTASFTTTEVSSILKSLVSTFATGYTTNNVSTTTTFITINWENKPFWDCIIDLCNLAGYDCYIDDDMDFHFFLKESITNEQEAIVEDDTLISQEGLSDTTYNTKNRIIVYGKELEGLPIMARANDTDNQSMYGVRELIIKDEEILTTAQAQERADTELELGLNNTIEGKATCFGMPFIRVGELIYTTMPTQNILVKYKVAKVVHKLGISIPYFFTTEVYLEKEPKILQHIIKDRVKQERQQSKSINKNNMQYSIISPFDSTAEASILSGTTIIDGKLKLNGVSIGNIVSVAYTALGTITDVEVRINCTDDVIIGTTATIEVSCDNGNSYTLPLGVGVNGNIGTKTSVSTDKRGLELKFRITLTSNATYLNPEINSIGILFNVE